MIVTRAVKTSGEKWNIVNGLSLDQSGAETPCGMRSKFWFATWFNCDAAPMSYATLRNASITRTRRALRR